MSHSRPRYADSTTSSCAAYPAVGMTQPCSACATDRGGDSTMNHTIAHDTPGWLVARTPSFAFLLRSRELQYIPV